MNLPSVIPDESIANDGLAQVDRETSVLEASKLMRKLHTTEVLVVDKSNGLPFIFCILTANDIVTRVIAAELDPTVMTTGDIAWFEGQGQSPST